MVAVIVLVVAVIIGRFAFMTELEAWPIDSVNRHETQASDAVLMGRALASSRAGAYIAISNEMRNLV
ncbi:hypothetical protein E9232_002631 [Inquilinus ginsengisoli]|uniref:Uncharacterized protein n=1 Tax=Inquilinus ginsengisoli TaxID=363840 RepID=A0ABU1JNB6_9PROT|nr:hypothetical protein [Inquilinus ginsengisoli]MDR6290110.1 hypothetical protein [Inquilinus ginsengisoli]